MEHTAAMNDTSRPEFTPSYSVHVFSASDLQAVAGANSGDPLMPLDELCLGDTYRLAAEAAPLALTIRDAQAARAGTGRFLQASAMTPSVASGSEIGTPGDPLSLTGRLTFMAPDGDKVELLLITHMPDAGPEAALYFLPMAPLAPGEPYVLVTARPDPGEVRLTDITPVAFTRGTLITLSDGRQCPVEELRIGEKVLTRDHGAQQLRWIGRRTVRAIGPYAPVVVTKGTLSNESDLIVSQDQRLFIYQRGAQLLISSAEVMVKARDLVDDGAVFIREGGFVEYFHLIFDRHEIIYAECTPTESLLLNERTLGRLPEDLAQEVSQRFPDLTQRAEYGRDAPGAPVLVTARRKPRAGR